MRVVKGAQLTALAIVVMVTLIPGAAAAQQNNQAALVIQFADGGTETWCVPFEGDTISGDELLARSELDILVDPSSGMGITVCRIEGLGCDYPAEHCFCQCMGGEGCAYWNYFYRDPGDDTWTYSPLGALLREVPPGGMEAWVWGDGTTPPAADLTFEAVCTLPPEPAAQEPAATTTPSPLPTETRVVLTNTPATPAATAAHAALERRDTPTVVPAAETSEPLAVTATETRPAPEAAEPQGGSYVAFGLIVGILAAAGLVVFLRQRGRQRT